MKSPEDAVLRKTLKHRKQVCNNGCADRARYACSCTIVSMVMFVHAGGAAAPFGGYTTFRSQGPGLARSPKSLLTVAWVI